MDEVEAMARTICKEKGRNPDLRQREYGQSSYDFWTWELFIDEAKARIFFGGRKWTEEQRAKLEAQGRAALKFNKIKARKGNKSGNVPAS